MSVVDEARPRAEAPRPLYGVGLLVEIADYDTLEPLTKAGSGRVLELYQLDLAGKQRRISASAIERGEVVYRLTDERGTWPERVLSAVECKPVMGGRRLSVIEASGQAWKLALIFPFAACAAAAYVTHGTPTAVLWTVAIAGGGMTAFMTWVIVRCPRCGDRWLWRAASTGFTPSMQPALANTACPACGLTGAEMQAARGAGR